MATSTNVYTSQEAARILGISDAMVRRYCIDERLRGRKIGRDWVIESEELERFKAIPRETGNPNFKKKKK